MLNADVPQAHMMLSDSDGLDGMLATPLLAVHSERLQIARLFLGVEERTMYTTLSHRKPFPTRRVYFTGFLRHMLRTTGTCSRCRRMARHCRRVVPLLVALSKENNVRKPHRWFAFWLTKRNRRRRNLTWTFGVWMEWMPSANDCRADTTRNTLRIQEGVSQKQLTRTRVVVSPSETDECRSK